MIKQQKEEEAWLRKQHAEDKEMYRQEVLYRNAVLLEQKVENAKAKEAELGMHRRYLFILLPAVSPFIFLLPLSFPD
jgi:hypothetical protein